MKMTLSPILLGALVLGSLGLAARSAGAQSSPQVLSWHEDARRPAAHLTDQAGPEGVDAWHRDSRRPAGKQTPGAPSGGPESWNVDSRRPDGRRYTRGEDRVDWWRVDDRRPASWPKADADSDGDGVLDSEDRCPDTPYGASVDGAGCPKDSDGDGVYDGLDRCPNTPRGARVDADGCSQDADGDGVPDSRDKCPNTPAGTRVDIRGCPMSSGEAQLIDAGKLRLNILFDTEKATIKPESYPQLDEVGEILAKHSQIRVEVGGHTDSEGDDAYNQTLSQARAEAVKKYWTSKFPSIRGDQLVAKGYGESDPTASNETAEGRRQNRRVELTVLNPEVLR